VRPSLVCPVNSESSVDIVAVCCVWVVAGYSPWQCFLWKVVVVGSHDAMVQVSTLADQAIAGNLHSILRSKLSDQPMS
jgi:hypothetical protein